jgi:hypothetical protein
MQVMSVINLSDLIPSPLREKVRMRGILKAFSFLTPLTPTLSRKEREFSFSSETEAW